MENVGLAASAASLGSKAAAVARSQRTARHTAVKNRPDCSVSCYIMFHSSNGNLGKHGKSMPHIATLAGLVASLWGNYSTSCDPHHGISRCIRTIYLTHILTFYLAYILASYLTYFPAFYLAFFLAFYLAYILTFYLAFYLAIFWHSI